MDLILPLIMITAGSLLVVAVLLFISFLFLLFFGRFIHPPSDSILAKLMNWSAYFDRMNTHLIYKPPSKAKLLALKEKRTKAKLDMPRQKTTEVDSSESRIQLVDVDEQDWFQSDEPFHGNDPYNSDYVSKLIEKLESLGIEVTDDSERLEIASTHRVQGWILNILLPDRTLVFDAEMISSGKDYGVLLNSFARITQGEWAPKMVRATVDFNGYRAFVEFEYQGEKYTWDFEHHFDWVSPEFHEFIQKFAEEHLPGRYINLRTESQESAVLYLPEATADELKRFLDQ